MLLSANEKLAEVTVVAQESEVVNVQMSNIKISPEELRKMPAFLGEVDVIKAVQFLPGVQSANEGSVNYIVRGGNPDQNLILLDGVPVYNVSHIFGFFSVFNPDAIKNIELTKGGFPAHFGGRLSSVLEGDMKEYHGSGSIGIIAAKFGLEGPIIKDKTSFMFSGRRTYSDLIYRPILAEGIDGGYYFSDLNFKLNHKFSRKDRVYLSFYNGIDKGFTQSEGSGLDEGGLKWGNYTGALRWNHLFSEKMFGNLTATYSRFNFEISSAFAFDTITSNLRYFSKIVDQGIKYDLDYIYSPKHSFRTGVSYTYHNVRPGALVINESDGRGLDIDSIVDLSPANFTHDAFLYVEDQWTVNQRLKVNTGLHLSSYFVDGEAYFALQPRLSARYLMSENWALKASYAYMQQFIHLLTNSSVGLPTDLWVSSTGRIPPQVSQQLAIGSTNFWDNKKWEFTTEAFYKDLSGLIAYKPAASFAPAVNWETQVLSGGTGRAYGLETLIRLNGSRTRGWIAYTLSKSEREFDEIDGGNTFPFKYDRRHDFKIVLSHDFTKKFNAGFTWIYNSGLKATIPISTYNDLDGQTLIKYSTRNAFSYPSYHRLDVALSWTKKTSWGQRSWGISVYNAYNQRNPFIIYFSTFGDTREATQLSLLQIIPSINYSFRF
jgi:outer membrane receptor for ferrienterochelin and colicin